MKSIMVISFVGLLLLGGCTGNRVEWNVTNDSSQGSKQSNTALVSENNQSDSHYQIKTIRDATELGPGPLTKENTSLGGIHIGDTQEKVKSVLGEPDEVQNGGGGSAALQWHYKNENTYIHFYRTSDQEPAGGVELILVVGPSSLKTEKGVGVGASAEDIFKNYQPVGVNSTKTGYRVNGVNFTEGGYHPYLQFTVDGDQKMGL